MNKRFIAIVTILSVISGGLVSCFIVERVMFYVAQVGFDGAIEIEYREGGLEFRLGGKPDSPSQCKDSDDQS